MKFCPTCGAQMADESKFCMECGTRFEVSAPAAPAPEMSYAPVQPEAPVYQAPVQPEPAVYTPAPAQEFAPQSYAPAQEYAPQSYAPAQEFAPQSYAPAQEFAPQSYAPAQEFAPQSYAPAQEFAPQSYAPAQEYAPQSYAPEMPQGFDPNAPQGYAPYAPQGFDPNAPQGFDPNAPQGYVPPMPQGFDPQGGYAAPQKPKKGMKKGLLFGIIGAVAAIVVAVLLIVLLGGGGGAAADGVLGRYDAVSVETLGIDMGANGEWIELKNKGKADINILSTEFSGSWELNGQDLTVTVAGMDYVGTLSNNTIVIDIYGMVYTFTKDGAAPAVDSSVAEAPVANAGDAAVEEAPVAEAPAEEPAEPAAPAAPAVAPFSPVYMDWGNIAIEIVGAEYFDDIDGADGIRVYYDFWNYSSDDLAPWWELDVSLTQNGAELESTYDSYADDVPEYGNEDLEIRPGYGNRCILEYNVNMNGGPVTVSLSPRWLDGEPAVVVLDPQNLPGRPSADFVYTPVTDPQWVSGLSDIGVIDGQYEVYVDNAETVADSNGATLLRVYFDFTNNSAEETSFFMATFVRAYQDGIELPTSLWNESSVAEEDNYYTDVAPGGSIRVAVVFELRSRNPIEVEVEGYEDGAVGAIYSFNS